MDKPKTVEELRKAADELGITRDRARELFEAKGLNGTFDPKKYDEYMAVLITESTREKALAMLRTKIATLDRSNELAPCPLCGSKAVRATKWDRFFKKDPVGWSCESGGVQHFLLFTMRPMMERMARKWQYLDEQWNLLKEGKITQTEYDERTSEKWMIQVMSQSTTTAT